MTTRQLPLQFALIWHSYLLLGICGLLASAYLLPSLLLACLLVFLDKRLWQPQRLAFAFLLFACAFAYASFALAKGRAITSQQGLTEIGQTRICGEIESVQGLPENKLRVILKDAETAEKALLPGLVVWTWENAPFTPISGQRACITRPLKPVKGFANYAEDSYEDSLLAKKMYWRLWSQADSGQPEISGAGNWLAQLREKLRQAFLQNLWPAGDPGSMSQARAILPALVFGDRRFLDQTTVNDFAAAAIAHSLALSGQHLGLAGLLALVVIMALALLRPEFYLKMPRVVLIVALSLPFALIYVWLGNAPASLLRALGMLVFAQFWLLGGRSFLGIDLLFATLAVILLINPLAIFDAGLQMSALCVGVILICCPALSRLLPSRKKGQSLFRVFYIRAAQILALSIIIQVALLPLTLARFQIAGFWFPLNVLWLPALGLIVLPGAAIALGFCLIPSPACHLIAGYLLVIASLPCKLLLSLLAFIKEKHLLTEPAFMIPHWTTMLAFAVLIAMLAWLWGNRSKLPAAKVKILFCSVLALLAAAPCLRLVHTFDQHIRIDALDAGQGQAILLSLPGGSRILVDGSGSYYSRFDPGKLIVAPVLCQNTAPMLTAVINTHPDMDHLGGLFHILSAFSVSEVFHNGKEAQKGNQARWQMLQNEYGAHVLASGDKIRLGPADDDIWLEVLHPPENGCLTGNSASLVLRLVKGDQGLALIPGDAEKANLRQILAKQRNIGAKVVFAPHHGSDKNLLAGFYKSSRPELVVACCGFMNRWGYPGPKLTEWLAANNITLLTTGKNGRISIAFDEKNKLHTSAMRLP